MIVMNVEQRLPIKHRHITSIILAFNECLAEDPLTEKLT